jgi:hypothetical protein
VLGLTRDGTAYWQLAIGMSLLGLGLGTTLQNLVLAVQNQVSPSQLGSASSSVTFFRTLGGTIGVSALGAVLAGQVSRYTAHGLAQLGAPAAAGGSSFSRPADLPAPVRIVVESAFGHATGNLFLYATPLALIALGCVLFIREIPLRTSNVVLDDHDGPAK